MTGRDTIKTRGLYRDAEEFRSIAKPFILTNHLPQCSNDSSVWRRMIIIYFKAEFVDNPTESHHRKLDLYKHKLISTKEFKSAFLKWLVIGSQRWYHQGKINIPNEVKMYIDEYRQENNPIQQFIDDCCNINNKQVKTKSMNLYNMFKVGKSSLRRIDI